VEARLVPSPPAGSRFKGSCARCRDAPAA
jgi:hypothetical protein